MSARERFIDYSLLVHNSFIFLYSTSTQCTCGNCLTCVFQFYVHFNGSVLNRRLKNENEWLDNMHTSYSVSMLLCLSDWRSGNTLASHRCDPCSIPGVGMWDGRVVTKSDRWVSSGYSGFLPHEDHPNANIGSNEHD